MSAHIPFLLLPLVLRYFHKSQQGSSTAGRRAEKAMNQSIQQRRHPIDSGSLVPCESQRKTAKDNIDTFSLLRRLSLEFQPPARTVSHQPPETRSAMSRRKLITCVGGRFNVQPGLSQKFASSRVARSRIDRKSNSGLSDSQGPAFFNAASVNIATSTTHVDLLRIMYASAKADRFCLQRYLMMSDVPNQNRNALGCIAWAGSIPVWSAFLKLSRRPKLPFPATTQRWEEPRPCAAHSPAPHRA